MNQSVCQLSHRVKFYNFWAACQWLEPCVLWCILQHFTVRYCKLFLKMHVKIVKGNFTVQCSRLMLEMHWIHWQEESESLCQCYEERCGPVNAVHGYFSSGAELAADDTQSSTEISTDNERAAGAAAATWTEPVQWGFVSCCYAFIQPNVAGGKVFLPCLSVHAYSPRTF